MNVVLGTLGLVLCGMRGSAGPADAGQPDAVPPPLPSVQVESPGADADGASVSPPGEGVESSESPSASPAADAVALTWEAPPACATQADVRSGLAFQLGAEASVAAAAEVQAVATVTEVDHGSWRLTLRIETASGVTLRDILAQDCAELADVTALVVAIAVDPSAVLGRTEPAAPPEPVEPAPVEPEVSPDVLKPGRDSERAPLTEPAPAPVAPTPPRRVRFGMRAAGGIDGGTLPGVAGGLRLAAAVLGRSWRAELRGDYWVPRAVRVADGIGARIGLWSLGAGGCGVPRLAKVPLEFPLCGGLEAGLMRGDPIGDRVAQPEISRRPWLVADASGGVAWVPRRYLALVLQAELVVPILRAGFRVGDIQVHRADVVSGRGLAGLEVRFP